MESSPSFKQLIEELSKKGCIDILRLLKESPKRWSMIEYHIKDKKSTSYRLKELINLGLIQITIIHDTPTGSKAYKLTPLGKKIVNHLEELEKEFKRYHSHLPKNNKFISDLMEGEK